MKIDNIKINPHWQKSKDDIWNDVFANLEKETSVTKIGFRRKAILYYAVASVAVLIILLPGIAFFYTKNEVAERGMHLSIALPDGSMVTLNAETQLSYKPLWWYISRDVRLEGEAYFEVEKGSTFNVQTDQYTVSVLGTSFNILSRSNKFNVTCLTGKVKVADRSQSIFLTPNMHAFVDNGTLQTNSMEDGTQTINWKQNKFIFLSVPLKEVIEEIERQYAIEIESDENLDYLYSGNFTKTENPNDILKIVGKPFGIELKIK